MQVRADERRVRLVDLRNRKEDTEQ